MAKTHLASDRNLLEVLEADRTRSPIGIVENDGDAGLRYACLSSLVYEILLVLRSHLRFTSCNISVGFIGVGTGVPANLLHVGYAKHKAYGVKNV